MTQQAVGRFGHFETATEYDMAFADALAFLQSQLSLAFSTEDLKQGVQAFFEKRAPAWRGG